MKYLTRTLGTILISTIAYITPASAYTFSFTNGTNEEVAVDFCGIAVIGCSMMQGSMPDWRINPYKESNFGKTRNVRNAGHLSGPQKIPAGGTIELNFNSLDVGVCLDLANIKVGLSSQSFSMITRDVVKLPNEYYDALFGAISQFGGDVSKMGEALSSTPGAAGTVAKAGSGLGQMLGSIGQLVRNSTCKNMSFMIIKDDKGKVSVTTKGL
jgi:hypothetical protein